MIVSWFCFVVKKIKNWLCQIRRNEVDAINSTYELIIKQEQQKIDKVSDLFYHFVQLALQKTGLSYQLIAE